MTVTGAIAVGVDGTESSRVALRWSARRAAQTGAELSVLHVVDDTWAAIGVRMADEVRADAQELVEHEASYAGTLVPGIHLHTRVLHGDVMTVLAQTSHDLDLIVVGTHKTGFVSGQVFGSRSLVLAGTAHAPVAIIPQTSRREGRGIVVWVDGSAVGRQAVRFAAEEARRGGDSLTLLCTFTVPTYPGETDDVRARTRRRIGERSVAIMSEAAAWATSVAPAVELRRRMIERPAAEALVAASSSASLVVVGNSGGDEGGMMVDSVTHDVLINLAAPTIVVREDDRRRRSGDFSLYPGTAHSEMM